MTRATSPTITQYPDAKYERKTTNNSIHTSARESSQSIDNDIFDFKDLKRELNTANTYEKQNLKVNVKN